MEVDAEGLDRGPEVGLKSPPGAAHEALSIDRLGVRTHGKAFVHRLEVWEEPVTVGPKSRHDGSGVHVVEEV